MKSLDDELRNLLKRKESPADFTARVLARIGVIAPRRSFIRWTADWVMRPMARWAAVGVACLALAAGLVQYQREKQRRAQAEQARQQAILALHIASTELNSALERAQRVTVQALAASKDLKKRME